MIVAIWQTLYSDRFRTHTDIPVENRNTLSILEEKGRFTSLSENADYPVPVVQLQQVLTHNILEDADERLNGDDDLLKMNNVIADENNSEQLPQLRRRLSSLQALN